MAKVKSSKIAHYVCAISRLRKCIAQSQDCLRNLEIGTQFRDSENALRNLEIAQIPKLRGTFILLLWPSHNENQSVVERSDMSGYCMMAAFDYNTYLGLCRQPIFGLCR